MKKQLIAVALAFWISTASAGAFGPGSFENDDALDWAGECVRTPGVGSVSTALQAALAGGYIEAPTGAQAIAAAEIVAASRGKPSSKLPPALRTWLERQPKKQLAALAPLALKALRRIRAPESSELHELWATEQATAWNAEMANLESRLK